MALRQSAMENATAVASNLMETGEVGIVELERISANAQDVMGKAMQLTDSWGQAMFVMDRPYVEKLFSILGFKEGVCTRVYEKVRDLNYVSHKQADLPEQPQFTWHVADASCLTLRGVVGLNEAMAAVTDGTVEAFLQENMDLFQALMDGMPDYAHRLMFSPEVAARVMSALGANVSADVIYDLAWRYGGQVTKDLEGRRGVSTQFVRSMTLTISARIQN